MAPNDQDLTPNTALRRTVNDYDLTLEWRGRPESQRFMKQDFRKLKVKRNA